MNKFHRVARFAQFHPPKLSLLVAIPLILINFRRTSKNFYKETSIRL